MARKKKAVNQDTFIKFRCSTDDKQFLEQYAKLRGEDVSKVIRFMVAYFRDKVLLNALTVAEDQKNISNVSPDEVMAAIINGMRTAAREVGCEREVAMTIAYMFGDGETLEMLRNTSEEVIKAAEALCNDEIEPQKEGEKGNETS